MIAENGIVHLKGVFNADECDEAAEAIRTTFNREGYHNGRIVNLHMDKMALLNISAKPEIAVALESFLPSPVVYTSLSFEYGTQQNIHLDVPHFWTYPLHQFVGVWTALEDIHKDAGALEYYEGSHKVPVMDGVEFAMQREGFNLTKAGIEAALADYEIYIDAEYIKAGCKKKTILAKKGDVIIWHPLLAHGGSKVKNKALSRVSYVTHWKARDAGITNAAGFFAGVIPQPYMQSIFEHEGVQVYKQPPAFEQQAYV
jgi:ectoine hydroxylase-related dioxygenase (phytanoyl-CoA dioxygenase family)